MVYDVYVIKNKEGKLYIGQTNKLKSRLITHNTNKSFYTKNKGPWELIFQRTFNNRNDAVEFEKLLKKQKGGNGLKKIIGLI
jgi:putative endonuclease